MVNPQHYTQIILIHQEIEEIDIINDTDIVETEDIETEDIIIEDINSHNQHIR